MKQQWLVKEEEKKRRVIVSDGEGLRRAMHPEQANESVRFVGGVELQYIRIVSVVARKAYIIVAVGETTPPKCAHDTVWAFTAKCTGAEQWLTIFVQGQAKKKGGWKWGGSDELRVTKTTVKHLLWHGSKGRDEVDHMGLARARSVPCYGAQSARTGPVERRDRCAIRVGHLNAQEFPYAHGKEGGKASTY